MSETFLNAFKPLHLQPVSDFTSSRSSRDSYVRFNFIACRNSRARRYTVLPCYFGREYIFKQRECKPDLLDVIHNALSASPKHRSNVPTISAPPLAIPEECPGSSILTLYTKRSSSCSAPRIRCDDRSTKRLRPSCFALHVHQRLHDRSPCSSLDPLLGPTFDHRRACFARKQVSVIGAMQRATECCF